MKASHSTFALGLASLALLSAASAQSAPTPPTDAPAKPPTAAAVTPAPATPSPPPSSSFDAPQPERRRTLPSNVSSALTASLPAYRPPAPKAAAAPKPATAPSADDDGDSTEPATSPTGAIDQPRNKIIRLPRYVVEEDKPPVFTERAINTRKGLAEIAMKRYFTEAGKALNSFRIPLLGMKPEDYAMMLYAEDERLQQMKDGEQSVYILRQVGEPASADALKSDLQQTYMRSYEMGPTNLGPK